MEDVPSAPPEAMTVEESYGSFKAEMKELMADWKALSREPLRTVSQLLSKSWSKTKIGEVVCS